MYTGLGLSAIIPIVHGIAIHGWVIQNHRMGLNWMSLMAAFNVLGAAVYAIRVGASNDRVAEINKSNHGAVYVCG